MTESTAPSARFLAAGDVALAAPFMLGYWPEGSACAVFVDEQGHAALVMRWDHDLDVDIPELPLSPAAGHLVIYPPRVPDPLQTWDPGPWLRAEQALATAGVPLGHFLLVGLEGGDVIWTSARTPGATRPVASPRRAPGIESLSAAEVASRAAGWGFAPWQPSRSDYVRDIEPQPATREAVERVLADDVCGEPAPREALIARVRALLADKDLSPLGIAEMLMALADVRVRDTVLWELMHDDPRTWSHAADRLAAAVAGSPESHVAPPATLLAILRWQTGDGSRAVAATERALRADSGYTLAALVEQCLATGMHPLTWRQGLADLTREQCLRAA